MLKRIANISIAAGMLSAVLPVMAGDVGTGERLYSSKGCIGCHGPAGRSPNPDLFPAIAGQDAAVLVEQLKAFRSGERNNPMMTPMAKGLSDQEIADLAAYLAAQEKP